jgi:hypothetical protein
MADFVETSGKRYLDVTGARVDTTAGTRRGWAMAARSHRHRHCRRRRHDDRHRCMFGVPTASSATVYAADINTNLLTTDVMFSTASAYGGFGNITVYGGVNISNASGVARTFGLEANGGINVQYGSLISGGAASPLSVVMKAYGGSAMLAGTIKTFGGDVAIAARDGIILGDGVPTRLPGTFGIIARRDGASGGTQTYDTAGYGGRILFDADSDRNGVGTFCHVRRVVRRHHQQRASDRRHGQHRRVRLGNGRGWGDRSRRRAGEHRFHQAQLRRHGKSAGAPYGGGDIAFLPTTTGDIRIGNFLERSAPHFHARVTPS